MHRFKFRMICTFSFILLVFVTSQVPAQVSLKNNAVSDTSNLYWDGRFDQLGVNGTVLAMAQSGSDLYVGGSFTQVGNVSANNIAKWDGSAWSALGSGASNGTDGNVLAIAVDGTAIYVGGSFSTAGGSNVNNIAKWNGSSWSALGSGISGGDVRAISVVSTDIYVGGIFTTAGGTNANNIAKWNGSNWAALVTGSENGVNAPVFAVGASGNLVYVGGSFTTAGGSAFNKIAAWNSGTSTWSALGSGVSLGDVNAVVVTDTSVIVGGNFTSAGGVNAKKIAEWDGSNWTALGDEIAGGDVNTMASKGGFLYVGGTFTSIGSMNANEVARWDGSSWSEMGSGIAGGFVFAVSCISNNIYVGGSFNSAGGKTSNKFALWHDPDATVPVELVLFTATPKDHTVELIWKTATEENNYGFEVERKIQGANSWQTAAFVPGHGSTTESHVYSYTDDIASLGIAGSLNLTYRLKQIDLDGTFEYFQAVDVTIGQQPKAMILGQNYPNPFNPQTTIDFVIPDDDFVELTVYNLLGQPVTTLVAEHLQAGSHRVKFDGSALPTGAYLYILRSSRSARTEKRTMILVK